MDDGVCVVSGGLRQKKIIIVKCTKEDNKDVTEE